MGKKKRKKWKTGAEVLMIECGRRKVFSSDCRNGKKICFGTILMHAHRKKCHRQYTWHYFGHQRENE
jgi:hypothetical protein